MGLLDSVLNPNVLGLMGLAQGLGQASAPSRMPVPMGVAAAQGMQGLLGGVGQGLQTAMMLQRMKLLQGLDDGSGQYSPQASQSALADGASVPSQGAEGAMFSGGAAPAGPGPTQFNASLLPPASAATGGNSLGMTPQQMFKRGYTMSLLGIPGGGDLMGMVAKYDPATLDSVRTLSAAGVDPSSSQGQAILQYGLNKPVNVRGFGYLDALGPHPLPTNNIPGTMSVPLGNGQWGVQQLPGAQGAIQSNQAAQTVGSGKGVDAQGNPVPLTQPVSPIPSLASPAPLRNNNPGALMPGGKLAQYPNMQAGLAALDQNLQSYGNQGVNTLSGIINKWAPPNENNTQAYINDVSSRLGIKPDQPIDLTNPAQRQALSTAIMLHENGPSGVFNSQSQQAAPVYGEAPLGVEEKAAANAQANVQIGSKYYDNATQEAQNLGIYRQALNGMWSLANDPNAHFGPGTPQLARLEALASNIPGIDLSGAQTSQDVMTKLANFMGMSQLGQRGTTGTDAQLNTILHSLPNGEMTNQAMKEVIPLLVSQLDVKQARANIANNVRTTNNADFSSLPDKISQFNNMADPGTVSIGMQLSNLQGQALQNYLGQLKTQYGATQLPTILSRVKQLDAMGAFHQ